MPISTVWERTWDRKSRVTGVNLDRAALAADLVPLVETLDAALDVVRREDREAEASQDAK